MRQLAEKKTTAQEKEQVPVAVFTQESYGTRCSGQKKAELNFWTHMPITICSRKTRLLFTPSTQLAQLQTTGKRSAVDSSWKTPVEIEVDNDEPGTSASSCLSAASDVSPGLVFNKRCETVVQMTPKLGFSGVQSHLHNMWRHPSANIWLYKKNAWVCTDGCRGNNGSSQQSDCPNSCGCTQTAIDLLQGPLKKTPQIVQICSKRHQLHFHYNCLHYISVKNTISQLGCNLKKKWHMFVHAISH